MKNQCFSSPEHPRARAAHPQKRIPFNGFGGRPLARGERRAGKRGPSGTHERVGVIEHGRPRNSTVRCCVLALRSRTGSHSESPRGPLFRHTASANVGRVVVPTGAAREYQPSNDFLPHWQIRPREMRESCPGLSEGTLLYKVLPC